jgi:hypothetical protein
VPALDPSTEPRRPDFAEGIASGAGPVPQVPLSRRTPRPAAGSPMFASATHDALSRPPSPWPGSQVRLRHRWQVDLVRTLPEAASVVRAVAAELAAAHAASWQLTEVVRGGCVLAERASRRQRGRTASARPGTSGAAAPPLPPWRLRVVDDPALHAGEELFDAARAVGTPVVAWREGRLEQVSGPALAARALSELDEQATPPGVPAGLWGVAAARVGQGLDVVASGSVLRQHAVLDGVLVRTQEALAFHHAADGAASLLQAAAAYERLAGTADEMAAVGGRLVGADDGFLHVGYPHA